MPAPSKTWYGLANKVLADNSTVANCIAYRRLIEQGRALALDLGVAVPNGVTDVPMVATYDITYQKDDDTVPLSLKPSFVNKE